MEANEVRLIYGNREEIYITVSSRDIVFASDGKLFEVKGRSMSKWLKIMADLDFHNRFFTQTL